MDLEILGVLHQIETIAARYAFARAPTPLPPSVRRAINGIAPDAVSRARRFASWTAFSYCLTTALPASVTAVCAGSLPFAEAPVCRLIDVCDRS